jgi:hypothetical protein
MALGQEPVREYRGAGDLLLHGLERVIGHPAGKIPGRALGGWEEGGGGP